MFALFLVVFVTLLVSFGDAFAPSMKARSMASLRMSNDVKTWPGVTAPLGFFDLWGLTGTNTPDQIKRWRESEIKHGRVCMIASIAIPISEQNHPFQNIDGLAINHFLGMEDVFTNFWVIPLVWTGLFEAYSLKRGWEPGFTANALKEEYVPGDMGFDPLNLGGAPGTFSKMNDKFKLQRTKELNNGRLAMLATAGMVAQEFVTGQTILGN